MEPWSKVDYSRFIREASMVVEKLPEVNPPSGRMPGSGLLVLLSLEARRRWNREENRDARVSPRVFRMRGKNRPKGGTRGCPHLPGALVARSGGGRATWPPGRGVAPLWPSFSDPEDSSVLIFI